MVCHRPAKFRDDRYCGRRDMILVCIVILQDLTI